MEYWYHQTTKTYIVAFSKLFSDIYVRRTNDLGETVKTIKVPLLYASKSKISAVLQNNTSTKSASVVLPAIGFIIEGLEYDPTRKMSSTNEINIGSQKFIYEGLPYDYTFTVTIRTKYQDDMWQILEQALYLFKPDISLDVKELPFPGFVRDVKIIQEGISLENETELTQDEDSSRSFISSLSFRLKGFIYPSEMDSKLIEHVDVNFLNALNAQFKNISHDWVDPDIITTTTEI
jgi:hypothetical protein